MANLANRQIYQESPWSEHSDKDYHQWMSINGTD